MLNLLIPAALLQFITPIYLIVSWVLVALVHIALALGVSTDAKQVKQTRKIFLVDGQIWAIATLLGGVVTAGIYWVIHHSTLSPINPAEDPTPARAKKSPPPQVFEDMP